MTYLSRLETLIAAFVVALFTPLVIAQAPERMAQKVINSAGKSCPEITQLQPLGTIGTDGAALIAVACSDGSQYALKLFEDDRFEYISTCSILEDQARQEGRDFQCFP